MNDIGVKLLVVLVTVIVVFSALSRISQDLKTGEMSPVVSEIDRNAEDIAKQAKEAQKIFAEVMTGATSTTSTTPTISTSSDKSLRPNNSE